MVQVLSGRSRRHQPAGPVQGLERAVSVAQLRPQLATGDVEGVVAVQPGDGLDSRQRITRSDGGGGAFPPPTITPYRIRHIDSRRRDTTEKSSVVQRWPYGVRFSQHRSY